MALHLSFSLPGNGNCFFSDEKKKLMFKTYTILACIMMSLDLNRISHEVVTSNGGGGSCDGVTDLLTFSVDIGNPKTTELMRILLMSASNADSGVYSYFV